MLALAQACGVLLLLAVALWVFGIVVKLLMCAEMFILDNDELARRFVVMEAKAAWKWPLDWLPSDRA